MTTDLPAPPVRETTAVDAAVDKLRWLLAHPPVTRAATDGEAAEYRHLLYDADTDATIPAFPYTPAPKEATA